MTSTQELIEALKSRRALIMTDLVKLDNAIAAVEELDGLGALSVATGKRAARKAEAGDEPKRPYRRRQQNGPATTEKPAKALGVPAHDECPGCGGPARDTKQCPECKRELCKAKCWEKFQRKCRSCNDGFLKPETQKVGKSEPSQAKAERPKAAAEQKPGAAEGLRTCGGCRQSAKNFAKCETCGSDYCTARCLAHHDECPACRAMTRGED